MPRASPALPCPASKINRFGIKKLSPIEVTTCAVGHAAGWYRPVLAAHHSATNFTESPIQMTTIWTHTVFTVCFENHVLFAIPAKLESYLRRRRRQRFPRHQVRPVRGHVHKRRHDHRHLLHV